MSSAMFFVICLSLYMMLQSAPSAHSDIREHDLEQVRGVNENKR